MLIHYWLFNALTGGHGQKHYDVKKLRCLEKKNNKRE